MQRRGPETVVTVDCHYRAPESAAAYLVVEEGHIAIVDTNTALAVPVLLRAVEEQGLTPDCVRYVVVTHAHLDHCGGAAELLKHCPKAKVLCHPRAERHLIDPTRLVESATHVYGREVFETLYGNVAPIRASRVKAVEDGQKLRFGKRTFLFLHTPGHSKHHIAMIDLATGSAFTGDAFGMHYPSIQHGNKPYIYFSSPPTDFDPEAARVSVRRVLDSGTERLCVSHFGVVTDVAAAGDVLLQSIDALEEAMRGGMTSDLEGDDLLSFLQQRVQAAAMRLFEECGIEPTPSDLAHVDRDVLMNARGIAYRIEQSREVK